MGSVQYAAHILNIMLGDKIMTAEEKYRDLLNECYPEVQIGYLTFLPSRIVEELDPIAFRCGVADSELEDD